MTAAVALLLAAFAGSASAVSGAAFTTVDETKDGTGHCKNGHPTVNCNIYDGKDFVWLNGGPSTAYLGAGEYFFAVMSPGGQADPNDGSANNLSDDFDAYTDRTFSVDATGAVSYSGPHDVDGNKIRLMPYANTTNPGGVYILAVCSLAANYPVDPSSCKYDAFKIVAAPPPGGATVVACKFNDLNGDGVWQPNAPNDEPIIGGWPITAVGVDGDPGGVKQYTDNVIGCTSWTVSNPQQSVVLTEGTLGALWTQTAPATDALDGSYTVQNTSQDVNKPNYVATIPLSALTSGATVEVDFGNTNPNCATPDACQANAGLTVTKTATPGTVTWGISKSVDKTLVEQSGGTVTFNYTVSVTYSFSYLVTGTITLANNSPADIALDTNTPLTDSVNNGSPNCTFTSTVPTVVSAGTSPTVDYQCSYSTSATPPNGTNTATAYWQAGDGFGAGSAFGTASITFTNTCVHVTDSYKGALGTVCVGADSSPKTFTYSRIVSVTPGVCTRYGNTATITETDQTSSQYVQACGTNTGGLTMGFWQNNNGQGIIKTGVAASNVCKSGTWLRTFAPFQDLSATATCTQVATYVYNVIKAATCSSSSSTCNAMLKAQMLATALDVYFSDPSLGGNKIGAYNGLGSNQPAIGAVIINLSNVCPKADGGFSGTCGENAAPVFFASPPAPPACLNVLGMLAYAASQSNAGGSAWYGQLKTKQVLAKDAFDAVNNQAALICPAA